VNWWASYAFCIWDGGFLPTEAEWEYAAAGGSEQRIYPWGSTAPGTDNQYAIYGDGENDCYYPTGTAAPCTGATNLAPVGTPVAGAGRWGQLDLAGNVWQWNLDWVAAYVVPCVDCAYLAPTTARIVRGGFGFLSADAVATLLAEFRGYSGPVGTAGDGNGFRCARVP
jgi:formylglycine-generating enzyme required for sulfatase activity